MPCVQQDCMKQQQCIVTAAVDYRMISLSKSLSDVFKSVVKVHYGL